MSSVRLRRLQSDYEKLRDYLKRQPRVRLIQAEGEPPERYQLEYQIKGLRQVDEQLYVTSSHMVEIMLPRNYPRMPPQCRMLTPVFHPNIAPHAICIGDHWSAGEPLWSMVARIGEMLAYQSYNVKSPLNGEAARWVDGNKDKLPLDRVSMLVEDEAQSAIKSTTTFAGSATIVGSAPGAASEASPTSPGGATPSAAQPAALQPTPAATPATATVAVACTHCNAPYKLPAEFIGRKVLYPGHYGQMGDSRYLIRNDRILLLRPLAIAESPDWYNRWVEQVVPKPSGEGNQAASSSASRP